ncbi:MAG TPA: PAS domain-containing sensor histidine kinase, partial [Salinimicrobium sp.]|nr:PAS domain-containing sensor histidine kinase [Salinimicrobium sp.]
DVTETVESKNLLAESESYFRQMADLMPDKVSSTDPKGKPDYFNRNWLDYTGLDSDTLKDLCWSEFVHPEEKVKFDELWQQSLRTGNNFEMELRYLSKEGTYKWHLSRFEAVRDEAGKIKMWIGTNTEIQKIKEEEKRKEEFLKMVSHELKTPITSIKGYVQLLLNQLKKEEERTTLGLPLKPSLERIDHQVRKLTRLISEMLDLSRLEERKLRLQKERFSINDLVRETVQDIKYTSTQHRVNIHDNYRCSVLADRDRIGQVLINFIINAIKYSPENPVIDIFIEEAGKDMVDIRVKDNGIGIEKKDQKNIFRRFYRIDGKNRETYSGFGIGLFLAKEIIERHNGEICVKSLKGEGSDFSFKLNVVP